MQDYFMMYQQIIMPQDKVLHIHKLLDWQMQLQMVMLLKKQY